MVTIVIRIQKNKKPNSIYCLVCRGVFIRSFIFFAGKVWYRQFQKGIECRFERNFSYFASIINTKIYYSGANAIKQDKDFTLGL